MPPCCCCPGSSFTAALPSPGLGPQGSEVGQGWAAGSSTSLHSPFPAPHSAAPNFQSLEILSRVSPLQPSRQPPFTHTLLPWGSLILIVYLTLPAKSSLVFYPAAGPPATHGTPMVPTWHPRSSQHSPRSNQPFFSCLPPGMNWSCRGDFQSPVSISASPILPRRPPLHQ
jgi:hypothetical protein